MNLIKDGIPLGQRFICIFDDHSGCEIMIKTDEGFINSEGDYFCETNEELAKHYSLWLPLPDDFEMWFEIKGE